MFTVVIFAEVSKIESYQLVTEFPFFREEPKQGS